MLRRKMVAAWVAVSVVLLAAGASAAPPPQLEEIARIEAERGAFSDSETVDKVAVVRLLDEAGVLSGDALLDGALDDAAADALATDIMTAYVGLPEGAVTLISILERMMGRQESWSLADKAWYSALMRETGKLGADHEVNLLPGDADLTETEAIARAEEKVMNMHFLTRKDLEAYTVETNFRTQADMFEGEPFWLILFHPGVGDAVQWDNISYQVTMNGTGDRPQVWPLRVPR